MCIYQTQFFTFIKISIIYLFKTLQTRPSCEYANVNQWVFVDEYGLKPVQTLLVTGPKYYTVLWSW